MTSPADAILRILAMKRQEGAQNKRLNQVALNRFFNPVNAGIARGQGMAQQRDLQSSSQMFQGAQNAQNRLVREQLAGDRIAHEKSEGELSRGWQGGEADKNRQITRDKLTELITQHDDRMKMDWADLNARERLERMRTLVDLKKFGMSLEADKPKQDYYRAMTGERLAEAEKTRRETPREVGGAERFARMLLPDAAVDVVTGKQPSAEGAVSPNTRHIRDSIRMMEEQRQRWREAGTIVERADAAKKFSRTTLAAWSKSGFSVEDVAKQTPEAVVELAEAFFESGNEARSNAILEILKKTGWTPGKEE